MSMYRHRSALMCIPTLLYASRRNVTHIPLSSSTLIAGKAAASHLCAHSTDSSSPRLDGARPSYPPRNRATMSFGIDPKRLDLGLDFTTMDFTAVVSATQQALHDDMKQRFALRRECDLAAPVMANDSCGAVGQTAENDSRMRDRDEAKNVTETDDWNDLLECTRTACCQTTGEGESSDAKRERSEDGDESVSHNLRTVRGVVNAGAVHDSRSAAVAYAQLRAERPAGQVARYTLMDALRDCAMSENWVKAIRVFEHAVRRASKGEVATADAAPASTLANHAAADTRLGDTGNVLAKQANRDEAASTTTTTMTASDANTNSIAHSSAAESTWSVLHSMRDIDVTTTDKQSVLQEHPIGVQRWNGGHFYILLKTLLQADRLVEVRQVWECMQQCGYTQRKMDARGANSFLSLLRRYGGGIARKGAHGTSRSASAPPHPLSSPTEANRSNACDMDSRDGTSVNGCAKENGVDAMEGVNARHDAQTNGKAGSMHSSQKRTSHVGAGDGASGQTCITGEGVLLHIIADIAEQATRRAWSLDERSRRIILTARIVQSLRHQNKEDETATAARATTTVNDVVAHTSGSATNSDDAAVHEDEANAVVMLAQGAKEDGEAHTPPPLRVEEFNTLLRSAPSQRATSELVTAMQKLHIPPDSNSYAGILAALHDPSYLITSPTYEACVQLVQRVSWHWDSEDGRVVLDGARVCELHPDVALSSMANTEKEPTVHCGRSSSSSSSSANMTVDECIVEHERDNYADASQVTRATDHAMESATGHAYASPEKTRYEEAKRRRIALAVVWFNACPLSLRRSPVYTELLYLLRSPMCMRAFDTVMTEWRGSSIRMRRRDDDRAKPTDVTQIQSEHADSVTTEEYTNKASSDEKDKSHCITSTTTPVAAPALAVHEGVVSPPRWRCPPTGKAYELLIQRARYTCDWQVMWQLYAEMRAGRVSGTARMYKILLDAVVKHPPAACARMDSGSGQVTDISEFVMRLHADMRAHRVNVNSVGNAITLLNAWSGARSRQRWCP